MGNFYLSHSAAELDEAVGKVLSGEAFNKKYTEGYNDGYEKGLEEATPTLQSKEVIPSLVEQTITADTGFDGLLSVFVQAVPKSILDAEYQKGYDEAFELYKPYKQEVPYIQSSGTQYIDTGFKPNQDTRVVMDAQMLNDPKSSTAIYFGCRDSKFFELYKAGSGQNLTFLYNSTYSQYFTVNYLARRIVEINKNSATVDGTTLTYSAGTFQLTQSLYLGADNESGTAKAITALRIYSCQIYDNGTLVRDYIPVLDWDDTPCLYDKVKRKMYYNAGTGSFTYA